MAYNNLSGTVMQPNEFLPRRGPDGNIIVPIMSGNLSTSDAAEVINVPRVSNATNNAIVTNVGGDANTLTCESNLTFDGTTLNIVGELTASVAISASYYVGDGSRLTGLSVGTGGGIFTQVAANHSLFYKQHIAGRKRYSLGHNARDWFIFYEWRRCTQKKVCEF